MDITIHTSTLPLDDPDASLAFWRDVLGCHGGFATAAEGDPHIERWNGCLEHLVEHLGSRSTRA